MVGSGSMFDKEGNNYSQRVTLRDVADALGVSLASVSLAMRENTRISESMRIRVRQKAEEMGYAPDPRMEALSRYSRVDRDEHRLVTLAWLNLWHKPRELYRFREFELYWQGATQAAARLGFRLEEIVAQGSSVDEVVRTLKEKNIRGILIAPHSRPVIDLERFPVNEFVMVRFGLETEKPVLYSVTGDQVANGEMVFERVRERGYERIGFVADQDLKLPFGAGFFWAQKELPKSKRVPLLLFPVATSVKDKRKILATWIGQEKPDAIVTNQPHIFDMLAGLGHRVPEEIAVATTSIHDTPVDAGLDQHPEEIGRVGLLKLVSLMNEAGMGVAEIQNQTLVKGEWVEGSMLPFKGGKAHDAALQNGRKVPRGSPIPNAALDDAIVGKRTTMTDIAKAVGVSQTAVSLAMHGNPRVSKEVRGRIMKAAEEMGYRPDPMLAAMHRYSRTRKERTIQAELAWFNVWENPEQLYAYHEFERYWQGAQESAQRHGFQLEEFIFKDFPPQRLDRILKTRNIGGILVPAIPQPPSGALLAFPWRDFVVVQFGNYTDTSTPYSVTSDQEASGELAFNRVRELGYRRIGFVGDHAVQRTFGAGFYWARRTLPPERQLPLFYLPLNDPARHRSKLAAWIRKNNPDAIVTDNGELPRLLAQLGIRVPDDIALAATSILDTPIDAGIDQRAMEIGRMGVVSLISHMNDPTHGGSDIPSRLCVMGVWVDGSMMPSKI